MGAYPGHNVTVGGGGGSGGGSGSSSGTSGSLTSISSTIGPDGKTTYSTRVTDRRTGLSTIYGGFGSGGKVNQEATYARNAKVLNTQIQQAQHWKNEGVPEETSYENLNLGLNNPVYNQGVVNEAIRQKQLRETAAKYALGPRVSKVPEDVLARNPNAPAVGEYPYAQWYVNPLTGAKYAGMAAAVEREQLTQRGINPDYVAAVSEGPSVSSIGGTVGGDVSSTIVAPTFQTADIRYGIGWGGAFEESTLYAPASFSPSSGIREMSVSPKTQYSLPSAYGWSALGGVLEQNAALRLNPLGGTLKTLSGMGKGLASYVGYEVGRAVIEPVMTKYYDFTSGVASKLPSSLQEPFLATAQTPGPPIFNTMLYYGGKDFRERFYRSQGVSPADIQTLEAGTMGEKFGSGGTFGQFSISLGKEAAGFAVAGGVGYAVNKALEAAPIGTLGGKATPYYSDIDKGILGVYSGGGQTQVPRNIERIFLTPKGIRQYAPEGQTFIDRLYVRTSNAGTEFRFMRQMGDNTYEMGSTRPIPTGVDQYSVPYTFPNRASGLNFGNVRVSPAGLRLPGGPGAATYARGQVSLGNVPREYTAQQMYKVGQVGAIKLRGIMTEYDGGRVVSTVAQESVRFPERPPTLPNVEVLPKVTLMPRGPTGGKLFKSLYPPSERIPMSISPQGVVAELKPMAGRESAAFSREASAAYRQASSGYSMYKFNPLYAPGVGYESVSYGGRVLGNFAARMQPQTANIMRVSNTVGVGRTSTSASALSRVIRNMQKTISQATSTFPAQGRIQYAGNIPAQKYGLPRINLLENSASTWPASGYSWPSFKFPSNPPFKFPLTPPVGGGSFGGGRSLYRGQFKIRKNELASAVEAFNIALGGRRRR